MVNCLVDASEDPWQRVAFVGLRFERTGDVAFMDTEAEALAWFEGSGDPSGGPQGP